MSKQDELRRLVTDYRSEVSALARYAHIDGDNQGRVNAVDIAEKRIFSHVAALEMSLENAERVAKERLKQLSALMDDNAALRQLTFTQCNDTPFRALPPMRFDEARAAAGEPVQVLFDKEWRDVKYIGKGEARGHVVECGTWAACSLSYWHVDYMRMKPTTKQLQMFANVYRTSRGVEWGALTTQQKAPIPATDRVQIAFNVPVTLTVAS